MYNTDVEKQARRIRNHAAVICHLYITQLYRTDTVSSA